MTSPDWLGQVKEDIIDPDRLICDPHHHLWDTAQSRYLLDELLADTGSGHRIASTVFVECSSMYRHAGDVAFAPVGETEFVQGIAAMSASGGYGETQVAAGIVGFADLALGENVKPVLEAHIGAATNRFRGIRHAAGFFDGPAIRNSHTRPPAGLMQDEQFQAGFAQLAPLGLSFDAWFYHYQLPEFVSLAQNFPDTTIVLDHFGGPLGIGPFNQETTFDEWRKLITPLQKLTNVHFKLGGINMKINGFDWHQRNAPPGSDDLVNATRHYYDFCIDEFGAERCMFESNFPVDKASCSYPVLWNAFKKIADRRSSSEQNALFHDTAARVYRL